MDVLKELFENTAFTNVVSMVLGGLLATFGGFINLAFSNRHALKMFYLQKKEKRQQELYEKKMLAYEKFVLVKLTQYKALSIQVSQLPSQEKERLYSLFCDSLLSSIKNDVDVVTTINLYGRRDIATKCNKLIEKYDDIKKVFSENVDGTMRVSESFDEDFSEIANF